ncbi:MAG: succinate dehydrogenase cytochrome b subunit [bacterium]
MTVTQTKGVPIAPPHKAFVRTSVGHKVLMALSGMALFGFVVGHMIGNLQIFLGQDQLNTYAQALKNMPELTWVARSLVLLAVLIHIWNGIRLWLENRASRPIGYTRNDTVQASLASRTMIWTGLSVLLYVVYHLLHFTWITTNPQYANLHDAMGRHDVYSMVVMGFQNPLISAAYIVAMGLIAYHLSHAVFSLLQTLGLNNPQVQPWLKRIVNLIAVVVFIGYVSMPIAVLAGIINLPGGGH